MKAYASDVLKVKREILAKVQQKPIGKYTETAMQMVSPGTDRCLRTLPNWLEVMNTAKSLLLKTIQLGS